MLSMLAAITTSLQCFKSIWNYKERIQKERTSDKSGFPEGWSSIVVFKNCLVLAYSNLKSVLSRHLITRDVVNIKLWERTRNN